MAWLGCGLILLRDQLNTGNPTYDLLTTIFLDRFIITSSIHTPDVSYPPACLSPTELRTD